MSTEKVFVDTNILVYAHDADADEKHLKAKQLVTELWHRDTLPVISIQVLQEFYVNLSRKKISNKICKDIIGDYLEWNVVDNSASLLMEGIRIRERYKLSLWDALIVAAALKSGCETLYSEDLNDGQTFDTVTIQNPLLPDGRSSPGC